MLGYLKVVCLPGKQLAHFSVIVIIYFYLIFYFY